MKKVFTGKRSLSRSLFAIAVCAGILVAADTTEDAIAAFRSGHFASAEQLLKQELRAHPNDEGALEIFAATLDQEHKYAEAGAIYKKALALAPSSPGLLNNYGNHLLAQHKAQEAETAFRKVLALDPKHPNALVQLARLAVLGKSPAQADGYLSRLPAEAKDRPDVAILRMQVAYELHRDAEANALLAEAEKAADGDGQRNFLLGAALAEAARYDKAETLFTRSLELQPDNFEALYDLGLAASHAGHWQRAKETLQQAVDKQPHNPDVLMDLAAAETHLNEAEPALELLVRARKLAPDRADIQERLARTAADAGYFGDAVEAWTAYLKRKPGDDVARRERAFDESALEQNMDRALADLESYVRKHPSDPVGHYELGTAASSLDRQLATRELNRAIALKPDLAAAYLARGLLIYRQGMAQASLKDFEKAVALEPENVTAVERLGQAYAASGRASDAVAVLKRADKLAPNNPTVLFQLGRALQKAEEKQEAAAIFARYKELRATKRFLPKGTGLVDWLSLSPDEQWSRYRAGVERTIEADPSNVEAQVRYLGLLLNDGKADKARTQAKKISGLDPTQAQTEEAARLLLEAREYQAAKELLAHAAARGIKGGELPLDAAVATMYLDGPAAGLRLTDAIPRASRNGDYELARATMLGIAKRNNEAAQALQAAIADEPRRNGFYRDEALLLFQQGKQIEAVKLLDRGIQLLPQDPVLRTLRAMALAMNGEDTKSQFEAIEDRWPEWPQDSLAHAFVLASNGKPELATRALNTAEAMTGASPALFFCRAVVALNTSPPELEKAKDLAAKGLALSPEDNAARALAAYLTDLAVNHSGSADRRKALVLAAALLFH